MKKIEIFDSAMCCPTGLCGANINPELTRIAVVTEISKKQGTIVTRYDLHDEPRVYISNKTVNKHLQKCGVDALPAVLVGDEIAVPRTCPTTKQMNEWTGISLGFMPVKRVFTSQLYKNENT